MSQSFQAVPLVDISDLSSPHLQDRRAAAEAIGRAAREVGFLYIAGHGLSPVLSKGLLTAAHDFFDQPTDRKMQAYIGRSTNHSGYVPEGEEVFAGGKIDRKEAYDVNLDAPALAGSAPMLGPTLWPDDAGFKAAVLPYYVAVAGLARRMFGGFALALGLAEDHFGPNLTAPPSQLRLIHYPFDADAGPDQQGIGAHTDYECFTILQSTSPGLEVRNGDGDWIDAPPIPGAFVVNIGDLMEAWTNGEFIATAHRVRKVGRERYSFPFFANCDYFTEVRPLPGFVGEGRPAAYAPFVAGEHLFAQTCATFAYLKARIARGELPTLRQPAPA
jgi:isopenicillin N synthase-like dioxygenase